MSADLEQIYLSNLQSPHKHAIVVAYSLSFSLSFSFSLYCTILFIYSSFVRSVSHLVFIPIYLSSHSFIYCLFSSFFFHNIHSHLILSFIHSFIHCSFSLWVTSVFIFYITLFFPHSSFSYSFSFLQIILPLMIPIPLLVSWLKHF